MDWKKGMLLSELIEHLEGHGDRYGDIPVHVRLHGSTYPVCKEGIGITVVKPKDSFVNWDMYILLES